MKKFEIQVNPNRCTGCILCQLACSERYTRAFNPSEAHIRVEVSDLDCSIHFTEECVGCGVCADNCFYNALSKEPGEAVR